MRYEYDTMMKILQGSELIVRDLLQEKMNDKSYSGPLYTYGDVQEIRVKGHDQNSSLLEDKVIEFPKEVTLTVADDFRGK